MKTMNFIAITMVMLVSGFNAASAMDKVPAKVQTKMNRVARIFMMENNAGIIRLRCEVENVKISVTDNEGKIKFESSFDDKEVFINVLEWDQGDYDYTFIKNDEIVKNGTIKVQN